MADQDDIEDGITFCQDSKFDIQLAAALIKERNLGDIFRSYTVKLFSPRLELKSETWLWEQSGNICIEYKWNGKPSGIAVTDADYWVHELRRDGVTLVYLMFEIDRLKMLCREAYKAGQVRRDVGDFKRSSVVLLKLEDILK